MFSLQKLAALIAIIGAAWYGFKLVERVQEARRTAAGRGAGGANRQNLLECRTCGTYVAASGGQACSRPDCPQG